jgi:DNA polymerase (family 10)
MRAQETSEAMPVQNAEIAAMFEQTADLLEIKGENPFRVRAYRRAARTMENLPKNVRDMVAAGADLSDLPGIGEDLAGKIETIVKRGRFDVLDGLKKKVPGDLAAMTALPGLGPKRVKLIYDQLHVRTLADLRKAVKTGKLLTLRGFGAAMEKKLAQALAKPVSDKRYKISVAEEEAEALVGYLRNGGRVTVAGSYRRRRDTVGDLDILVTSKHAAKVGDKLTQYDNVAEVVSHGPTRSTVILRSGIQVDLRAVDEKCYGAALLYFTGSKAHNIALRNIAVARKWKLNEYGLFAGQRRIAGTTEEEIYKKLGLHYVPPEMREDRGEIALAKIGNKTGKLPKLVTVADIRGDLHCHSTWTDGTAPIEEMAKAAQARGYRYMALTDHSKRVTMAHGLDAARLSRQGKEIDKLNAKFKNFTILKGIEVDILKDGTLDLPDSALVKLDVVVASVHSFFDLSVEAQTERVIRAMQNKHVHIIGHPTGRLIGSRAPYAIDMDRITSAARELGCFLEINAQPERLDLNDIHAHMAKTKGVKLAVSTDSHAVSSFDYIRFGIDQARRAWLTASDVINTRSLTDLRKLLKR